MNYALKAVVYIIKVLNSIKKNNKLKEKVNAKYFATSVTSHFYGNYRYTVIIFIIKKSYCYNPKVEINVRLYMQILSLSQLNSVKFWMDFESQEFVTKQY